MNAEKLDKLKDFQLSTGAHDSMDNGGCIMEMVSYFADEPWSDSPACACPILTRYAIALNDTFNVEDLQRLKEFIPVLVGTRANDETQIARKRLIMWRNVTATFPIILDVINLPELAAELRAFKNTLIGMAEASNFLQTHKETTRKAAYAYAYAYAYANANAYAYAYANADAYANAYANADAYAYALRLKIVDVAIETLRMAIEIKL